MVGRAGAASPGSEGGPRKVGWVGLAWPILAWPGLAWPGLAWPGRPVQRLRVIPEKRFGLVWGARKGPRCQGKPEGSLGAKAGPGRLASMGGDWVAWGMEKQ